MTSEITLPNFKEIAANTHDREQLAEELEKAFEMGRALGRREGGESGWQADWDSYYTSNAQPNYEIKDN